MRVPWTLQESQAFEQSERTEKEHKNKKEFFKITSHKKKKTTEIILKNSRVYERKLFTFLAASFESCSRLAPVHT